MRTFKCTAKIHSDEYFLICNSTNILLTLYTFSDASKILLFMQIKICYFPLPCYHYVLRTTTDTCFCIFAHSNIHIPICTLAMSMLHCLYIFIVESVLVVVVDFQSVSYFYIPSFAFFFSLIFTTCVVAFLYEHRYDTNTSLFI